MSTTIDGPTVAGHAWPLWSTRGHLLVTDRGALEDAVRIAERWTTAVGDACDRFRSDSELSRITDASHGIAVSPVLADLLDAALQAAAISSGAVDPTVGSALVALGYDRDLDLVLRDGVPTRVVVTEVPGWRRVDLADGVLTMPAGVRLDLGATAKAVAADRIAATVAAELGVGVLVNLGGDIATAGTAPGAGWQVAVQDLPADPATQVSLAGGWGLATSSTQRRRWSADGEVRHHIVDPATGRPAESVWRSASVVAPTALLANTYATMAVVLGRQAPAALDEARVTARLVDADGVVHLLGGWPAETLPKAA
ncbi:MAG TPA: FAD:protein FMN transferase [Amnibacterium sp.]|uniref:FAD:protein FMN transferase n=1 Tax=Amnibacterium sp. TaxID=1872496 RepID=UPI002F93B99F